MHILLSLGVRLWTSHLGSVGFPVLISSTLVFLLYSYHRRFLYITLFWTHPKVLLLTYLVDLDKSLLYHSITYFLFPEIGRAHV